MTLPRRTFLRLAAGAAALPALPRIVRAQAYPSRPITMVVPYLGGGPADGLARPLAERMSKALGQPVVVENIPGQSGVIGVARAVKAAPDGYTLSYGHNGSHVVNGAVYSLPYDLRTDLEPVALLPSNPLMISARKDFPAADLKELIAWVKANPGKVGVGNVGPASGTNVNAIYFQNITGTRFQFVPHKSVQTAIKALTTRRARSLVRSGVALAVVSARGHHQGLRRHVEGADGLRARRTDHRRRRPAGIPQRELVRAVGAQGHAEGYRGPRQSRRGRGAGRSGVW